MQFLSEDFNPEWLSSDITALSNTGGYQSNTYLSSDDEVLTFDADLLYQAPATHNVQQQVQQYEHIQQPQLVYIQQQGSMYDEGKQRHRLSKHQTDTLMQVFRYTQRPTAQLRQSLSLQLGLTCRQVQIFFQNKRAKSKRDIKQRGGNVKEIVQSNIGGVQQVTMRNIAPMPNLQEPTPNMTPSSSVDSLKQESSDRKTQRDEELLAVERQRERKRSRMAAM